MPASSLIAPPVVALATPELATQASKGPPQQRATACRPAAARARPLRQWRQCVLPHHRANCLCAACPARTFPFIRRAAHCAPAKPIGERIGGRLHRRNGRRLCSAAGAPACQLGPHGITHLVVGEELPTSFGAEEGHHRHGRHAPHAGLGPRAAVEAVKNLGPKKRGQSLVSHGPTQK